MGIQQWGYRDALGKVDTDSIVEIVFIYFRYILSN